MNHRGNSHVLYELRKTDKRRGSVLPLLWHPGITSWTEYTYVHLEPEKGEYNR